jgi:hypothetical protein
MVGGSRRFHVRRSPAPARAPTTQWLAVDWDLTGIIVGGAIGVAGLLAGWLNLRESHKHERTMAREAREQERLGNAYVQAG